MIPTIEQVMKCYRVVAQSERMKTGRPGENTVQNVLRGTKCVCRAAGIGMDSPITALTRKAFDAALSAFVDRGLSRVTAWSYICQLQAIFARWCKPYYQDAGWEIPPLELPSFRAQASRYVPHKTALTSGRRVYWPIHDDIWRKLNYYADPAQPNVGAVKVVDLL